MTRFTVTPLPLSDLQRIERKCIGDSRGFFSRLFCAEELGLVGWRESISQINYTYTAQKGTIRGLHFQYPPYAEMKLVTCLQGEIWDIVVDIRANSPTFLKWHAEYLSKENRYSLLVPKGFAHGFQTLTDNVELLYCHSAPYISKCEGGLNPMDSQLGINWPLPISELSSRDSAHPLLTETFLGVTL